MISVYVSREERAALESIDEALVDKLIDKAISYRNTMELQSIHLERCGPFVTTQLRNFNRAISDLKSAKSARKIDDMDTYARRTGLKLSSSVHSMKHKLSEELREDCLFHVEDGLVCPSYLGPNLSLTVAYRWRLNVDDDWNSGSITLSHDVRTQPRTYAPPTKRKVPLASQKLAEQRELARTWEYLAMLSLHAVRDYFRAGRDGAEIPDAFVAKRDSHTGDLNNFSADFWGRSSTAGPGT